ncbi:DUF6763 family protein [Fontimonas sp. SYSU GA230001]|uniref:DUF6763 family protein n=1 Tax=Fontimonas sp. SYSU GA230001 TaxID=3142450 RepID=UPI0032B39AE5
MAQDYPEVGQWYRRAGTEQAFVVVAVDERDGAVEVQYFDGTVDELRLAQFVGQELERCEAPQDWTGPFDGIARDDLGATETDMSPEDWNEPYGRSGDTAAPEPEAEARPDPALLSAELLEQSPAVEALYARPTGRMRRRRH